MTTVINVIIKNKTKPIHKTLFILFQFIIEKIKKQINPMKINIPCFNIKNKK